jgi:beta-N-acetylhexosaminidase
MKPDYPPLSIEQALGQKFLLSFWGKQSLPQEFLPVIQRIRPGGFTLYRSLNLADPEQVRALTASLQKTAPQLELPPFLIAADQEGGQLLAVGSGATPFPGNLALGAAGSDDLARRTGAAIGLELAAMGINVNYAPVCDLLTNPRNTSLGTRAFSDDPALTSRLASAMIAGLQSAGVAATAKHFPGYGEVTTDAHFSTPVLSHTLERLRQVELPPFAAAIEAGVKLVMTGHQALPALDAGLDLPATLSRRLLGEVLRGAPSGAHGLGYTGLVVTDALDMGAIEQGDGLLIDCLAAFAAGVDLLLFGPATAQGERLQVGLLQAVRRGLLSQSQVQASAGRVLALKDWLSSFKQPDLEVVGCAAHQALALETARRAVTLVRDRDGLLPLTPAGRTMNAAAKWLALTPIPADLTPAETSSYVKLSLADVLRGAPSAAHGGIDADERTFHLNPPEGEIREMLQQAGEAAGVLVGTYNAIDHPGQIALLKALARCGAPVIAAALRSPFDAAVCPALGTWLCTYSIQPPAIQALGEALWGRIPFGGTLPVKLNVE